MTIGRLFRYSLVIVPLVVCAVILVSISIIMTTTRSHIYEDIDEVPTAEAALILGAGVLRNGGLSAVLADRVDQAIDLYNEGKVVTIIASGNRSPEYNEVDPIVSYLTGHGIPADAIITDYAGYDTYASIYRARHVFSVTSMHIVTQSFHLPRAVFIARQLGIEAAGVSADRGRYKMSNYFREMFADVKAVLNLLFSHTPESVKAQSTDLGIPVAF